MLRHPGLVPLSHDHQHALALCVLATRALAADPSPASVARVAVEIVRQFDSEIRAHFDFEEQVLFPALAHIATLEQTLAELRAEHIQLTNLVDTLRSSPDAAAITQLTVSFRAHIRKEEQILFESAQETLPSEQLDRIGAQRRQPANLEISRNNSCPQSINPLPVRTL